MNPSAYVRTFTCCVVLLTATVQAYQVNTTTSGAEIKWSVRDVAFLVNQIGGPAGTSGAIQAALNTWSAVVAADFDFVYSGTTALGHNSLDSQNVCCFGDLGLDGTIARNTTYFTVASGELLDSDIVFNTRLPWSTAGAVDSYDVQNVATHELGHALSLADLYNAGDAEKTMYGLGTVGETKQRSLEPDDIAGLVYLYPQPIPDVTLSVSPSTVLETGGSATATAYLSNPYGSAVTVDLGFSGSAALGSDYTTSSDPIVIPVGALSGSCTIQMVHDTMDEGDETINIEVVGVVNGTEVGTQQGSVSIVDDDIRNYAITASAGTNGTVVPTGTVTNQSGGSRLFTATPVAGGSVDRWSLDGQVVQTGGTNYTLGNIRAPHTVGVTFILIQHEVQASAGTNGTIAPSGSRMVVNGFNQQFTATPSSGFEVDGWFVDNTPAQIGGTNYLLLSVSTSHVVQVTFRQIIPVQVTISAPRTGAEFTESPTLTVKAQATGGYQVTQLVVAANSEVLTVQRTNNVELTWPNVSPGVYSIVAVAWGDRGNSSTSAPVNVIVFADSDADGLPDEWELAYFGRLTAVTGDTTGDNGRSMRWYFDTGGNPTGTSNCFSIPLVDLMDDGTVTIEWNSISGRAYTVSMRTNLCDDAGWVVAASDIVASGARTFYRTAPQVVGGPRFYRCSVDVPLWGEVNRPYILDQGPVTGFVTHAVSTQLRASNHPDAWYAAGLPTGIELTQSGTLTGVYAQAGTYDATLIAANQLGQTEETLRFMVMEPTYTLRPTSGPNGAIAPTNVVFLLRNSSFTFAAIPVTDYEVDGWIVDDVLAQSRGNSFELVSVQADHDILVTFRRAQYTVNVTCGAEGSVAPSGTVICDSGSSLALTAAPNMGWTVDKWYVDGVTVRTGGNSYTVPTVRSNHVALVTFKQLPRFTVVGDYVIDNTTNLKWKKNANLFGSENLQDASDDCSGIGYRLPTLDELFTLYPLPAGHPFTQVVTNGYYWSTTKINDAGTRVVLNIFTGGTTTRQSYQGAYVWPVK